MGKNDFLFGVVLAGMAFTMLICFVTAMRTPAAASPVSGSLPEKTYTNVEEWEFMKDKDGRVLGLKVHRTAKQT